ncbi:MAG: IPExxxVDY family protein [Pricia sp.]
MVAVHRLSADIYEADFDLIALHSHLKDYALAYSLNLFLKSGFCRRRTDLDISSHIRIPIFEWKDDINERYWTFFANHGKSNEKLGEDGARKGLFVGQPSGNHFHMVPEYREADYFLKIEQEGFESHRKAQNGRLVKSLQGIPKIWMAYSIETEHLKSRNNLIF